jgi:hypothetical protein
MSKYGDTITSILFQERKHARYRTRVTEDLHYDTLSRRVVWPIFNPTYTVWRSLDFWVRIND